jgi:hypothetical protein
MSDLTGALAYKVVRGSEIFPLMSAWGHSRRFCGVRAMSAIPPIAANGRGTRRRSYVLHGWIDLSEPAGSDVFS